MSKTIKKLIWQWPDGLVWRFTRRITERSRRRKYALFLQLTQPSAKARILDVGVGGGRERGRNFLEATYPYPEQITAVGMEDLEEFQKEFPRVKMVRADACDLPFKDHTFDVVFSNAVLEHVGDTARQQQFIRECLRVGNKVFIATPAREFPVDPHTLIPFAHWLPMRWRNIVYRWLGRDYWAAEERLNLPSVKSFRELFPRGVHPEIHVLRILGIPSVIIGVKK